MSNKIKVLQIIHGMYLGGAENVVYNILKNIDRHRYELSLCCIHGAGELGEKLINAGYQVKVFNKGIGVLETFRKIKQHIREVKPDIIHTHGVSAFLAIGPLYVFNKLPVWTHTFHFGNYPNIKKSYLYGQRVLARFVTKFVAVSESQRKTVIDHLYVNPDKIITIFNGVPENPYKQDAKIQKRIREEFGFTDKDIVIACIVVLTEQKGVSYFLKTIDRIVASVPQVKILIVGGGPLENVLRDQATRIENPESVIFTGWRQDIHELMASIDIFVLPSLWEGLPMVLLEAMASSLPIVATNVADNYNLVGYGDGSAGYTVPPGDSEKLGDAIIKLAKEPNKAKQMGKNSLIRYENGYTVDKMVQGYEDLYKKILG